jgi:hypothetical protein
MLLVAMLAIAVMSIQGSIATTAALNNITTSIKARVVMDATAVAQAGIEEAKARIVAIQAANLDSIGNPLVSPDPLTSYYFLTSNSWTYSKDPDYNADFSNYIPTGVSGPSLITTLISANSLQSTFPYWAKMRHKVELDAESRGHTTTTRHYTDGDGSTSTHTALDRGNIIYYGYRASTDSTPVQFTTAGFSNASPVELIMAYGENGTTTKGIEVEMARDLGPPVYSPMYSEGNVTFTHSGSVSGTDSCAVGPNRPPLYLQNPATVSGSTTYAGSPATPQSGTLDVDRTATIQKMKAGATVVTADLDSVTFGSATNYVTVYTNTASPYNANGLQIINSTGHGTLLVDGDLILGGDVTWNGLIITTGRVTLQRTSDGVGEPLIVRGAILSAGVDTLNSGYSIQYHSCHIAKAMGARPLKIIRWRSLP